MRPQTSPAAEYHRDVEHAGASSMRRPIVVRVLGTPLVERQGVAQAMPGKALALLAILALELGPGPGPGAVSKDLLADRLWPDSAQARANLRKAIKAVRDLLGAAAIDVAARTVALGADIDSDAHAFGRALADFDAHHPDMDVACGACVTSLAAAAALWRGDVLDGQALEDSPVFEEWRIPHAERLRADRGRLLAALVRAHVARRAWDAADRVAVEAQAHSPLDEAALRARMRVLAWSGRRAEALKLFEQAAEVFEADLGVGPSERSVALLNAIRGGMLPPPPSPGLDVRFQMRTEMEADVAPHAGSGEAHSGLPVRGQGHALLRKAPTPPPELARMLAAVRAGEDPAELPEELLRRVARHEPMSLPAYLLACAARWLAPPNSLARRFVPIDIVLAPSGPPDAARAQRRWSDVRAALAELDADVAVLLGRPGAGKTTILRRLDLDLALRAAAGEAVPVPLFAPLARFSPTTSLASPSPRSWLERIWDRQSGSLTPMEEVAREQGLLVLLDGFDEMPDGRDQARAWREFIRAELPEMPGVRMVISCREVDFDIPSSNPEEPWPRLVVQPLSPAAMRTFVDVHVGEGAREHFWQWLEKSSATSLYRTPYLLKLLTAQSIDGEPPTDVAALLTSFVRSALMRELERDHPALSSEVVLHERDVRQLVHDRWSSAYALPTRGRLVPGLEELAAALLRGLIKAEVPSSLPEGGGIAHFDRATLKDLLGEESAGVVTAALGLGLLGEDLATDRLYFDHRLLLDYFAARRLAAEPDPAPPVAPWRWDDSGETLETAVLNLAAHEPVPPLRRTGWEETLSMAAIMAEDPDGRVLDLATIDLPLAALSVARAQDRFSQSTAERLRERLAERCAAGGADIRARIAAGEALGEIGDPRFVRVEDERGAYLLPPMCPIEAGRHPIGSDDGAADEAPLHGVALSAFEIGRFEVTNAEWACFMAAGGYELPLYWETPDAAAWREGRGTDEGPLASAREWTERFRADPDRLEELFAQGHMPSEWHATFRRRIAMSAAELEAHLSEMYPGGRLTEPRYWDDPRFSNSAQPVVGISWYEARAYAAWLAARSGRPFRLPTEAEWEAACRRAAGDPAGADAGGVLAINTSETHLWRPTPVGVMGGGPELADMLGNVWEWTSSLYGREPDVPDFAYPYASGDGREDPAAPSDIRRVTRGGAWDSPRSVATPSVRDAVRPGGRDQAYGMRLACDSG